MTTVACDIAIMGGGPAGTACAISLRLNFPQWQVAVFEGSDYCRPRAGEVLPAHAVPLLRQLRIPLETLSESSLVAEEVASAWGGHGLVEQHHLFSGSGAGLHLDRNAFDRNLSGVADALGATVHCNTPFQLASRIAGKWHIALGGRKDCQARFVIDATGRSGAFARSQGARFRRFDRLTAYSRFFDRLPASEHRTVVEACPLGWWYTAPLPYGRRVVSLLTDADLGRAARLPDREAWDRSLRRTRHVAALLHEDAQPVGATVASASSGLLNCFGQEGWLATGDAAASCDPLAGQGITSALRSGILASYAAADALSGNGPTGLHRYEAILQAQFAGFRRMHRAHYARESRWQDQPFWQRRSGVIADDSVASEGSA